MKEANNNIPQHWEIKKLNDVVSVLGDGLHGTPKYADNGDYFFINGNNLCDGKIVIKENTKRVSKEEYEKYKKPLNQNTILVSINGTLGNIAFYNNEKVILGKSACYFNVLETIDKNYLRILLSGLYFLNYASNTATGSTIQNVSLKAMREFELPLPPLPEQVAIVNKIEELFSELENGKEQLLTAQRQLKIYRQSLLKAAFGTGFSGLMDGQDNTNKPDNTKSRKSLNPVNPDADSDLPEGWKWVKLEEVADKITDGEHFRPKTHEKGIPFLSAKDVRDEGISFDDPLYIDEATAKKAMQRCNPQRGDILIVSRGATVGRMCIVNTNRAFCLLGSVILIKVKETVNSKLLNFILKSPIPNRKLVGVSGATAQQAIYLRDIKSISIPLPPLPVQQAIVEILESKLTVCDKLEETISHSLEQTETLRQSILKKAFEGRLV